MGIFDGLMSWGSSVLNSISSGVSSVVSSASSVFSGVSSAVTSTVSNASSFVSSAVSSAGSAAGSWAQGATSYVSDQVSQAARAVEGARKAAENAVSGLIGGVAGGTTQALNDANKNINDARKQIDAIIAAGGTVSASVLNQLGEAADKITGARQNANARPGNTGGGGNGGSGNNTTVVSPFQPVFNNISAFVSNAATAASNAFSGIGDIVKNPTLALPNILDAEATLNDAKKQFDSIIKSGGEIPSYLLGQYDNAKRQIDEKKKEIKVATDNNAKAILDAATAAGNTATKTIDSILGGARILSVSPTPKVDLTKLDYSNPNVKFTDEEGNDRGHLGQYASPYAVANDAVFFNTGGVRGGSNAPADKSSWTDTPDDQKLHDYGLSGNVVYTSRNLDSAEQQRVLDLYRQKGWLNETTSTVTDRATKAVQVQYIDRTLKFDNSLLGGTTPNGTVQKLETVAADTNLKYNFAGDPAGAAVGVTTAALGSIPAAMSGGVDAVISKRDELIGNMFVGISTGNIAQPNTALGAAALAADIAAPLDLINCLNLLATGRGDEISMELAAVAALDAIALAAIPLTGGASYLGVKALKTAAKSAKVVGYGGQGALGVYGFGNTMLSEG